MFNLFLLISIFTSCQPKKNEEVHNVKKEIKSDTLVENLFSDTSLYFPEKYYDYSCGEKICSIIESRIIKTITYKRYQEILYKQKNIRFSVSYNLKGEIIYLGFQKKCFTDEELGIIKRNIIKDKLEIICHGYSGYELKRQSNKDLVNFRGSLPCNSN